MEIKNKSNEAYKKMICALVQDIEDGPFLHAVHSLLFREQSKTCKIQRELHGIVERLPPEDVRLLYIAALELLKGGNSDG